MLYADFFERAQAPPSKSTTKTSHHHQSAMDPHAMDIDFDTTPGNPVKSKPARKTDAMDIDIDTLSQSTAAKEPGLPVEEDVEMSG